MRDDQKRALLADGGKGEAVATLHDDGHWTWKKGITPPHESSYAGWRMDVYAAPQAECAPRKYVETQPGSPNFDGAEAYEAHLNAECAPRGAQPVTEILRLLSKMHDECGTNAGQDALWDAHEAVEQLLAAPTPERAQEGA